MDNDTVEQLEYCQLIKNPKYKGIWLQSMMREVGQLSQGVPGVIDGMDTCFLSTNTRSQTSNPRIVVDIHETKEYPYQTHKTLGGNIINYPGDCQTSLWLSC